MQAIVQDRFGPPDVLELRHGDAGGGADLPLREAADALRYLGEGHARGKLVVAA